MSLVAVAAAMVVVLMWHSDVKVISGCSQRWCAEKAPRLPTLGGGGSRAQPPL